MERGFWLDKWDTGKIGFHRDSVHDDLEAQAGWLLQGGPQRVLVPLCGKSWDLLWLADQGHRVIGVELAAKAIESLHAEHDRAYTTTQVGPFTAYHTTGAPLTVLCGDVFDLTGAIMEEVAGGLATAIWDRAALVALRPDDRARYVALQRALSVDGARVLLNVLDYDPEVMSGPPWNIPPALVEQLWGDQELSFVGRVDMADTQPGLKKSPHQWFHRDLYTVVRQG